jgi:hypothetical protein
MRTFTAEHAESAEKGTRTSIPGLCAIPCSRLRVLRALGGEHAFLCLLCASAASLVFSGCASNPKPAPSPVVVAPRPESAIIAVEPWTFADRPGEKIRTRHFLIHTTEMSPLIHGRIPAFLESSLDHYRFTLAAPGAPLPEPPQGTLDTFILDNRSSWERLTRQLLGEHAGPYLQIGHGGYAFSSRAVLFDIGASGTLTVAAHEGWHQYTQATFAQPLPVWLEEGVATYMEGHRWSGPSNEAGPTAVFLPWANLERFDQLRDAATHNQLLPLQMLLDEVPQDLVGRADETALTYYAQLWALVHFLADGDDGAHREALEQALADAAAGRLVEHVAKSIGPRAAHAAVVSRRGAPVFLAYFGDPKALEAPYRAFIARITAVGARGPIAQGESPLAK